MRINVSTGKTGYAGPPGGWKVQKVLTEWDCACGEHNAKHWARCPKCGTPRG